MFVLAILMTRDLYTAFSGVIFYSLLHAPHGKGLAFAASLFNQKNFLFSRDWPLVQVKCKSFSRIIAYINNPVLASLAAPNYNLTTSVINSVKSEISNLLNPEATAQHEHENCLVPGFLYTVEEENYITVSEISTPSSWYRRVKNWVPERSC